MARFETTLAAMFFGWTCAATLSACASTPPPAAVQVHCLPLVQYSPEDQKAAASELAGAGEHVKALIRDYEKMRDADRACLAAGGQ